MCGIVGYIGKRKAFPILIKGLHRLEYRGYDSAGCALITSASDDDSVADVKPLNGSALNSEALKPAEGIKPLNSAALNSAAVKPLNPSLRIYKAKGKVSDLEASASGKDTSGSLGIAHTRWATHGVPSEVNAHPHVSQSGNITLVHNGIIENYATLREQLKGKGYEFKSETDTEVLVQLIEQTLSLTLPLYGEENHPEQTTVTPDILASAVRSALRIVIGAYAIAVIDRRCPNVLVAARKSSPLAVGVVEDNSEFFLASDASPIAEYTNKIVYLKDEEIAVLERGKDLRVFDLNGAEADAEVKEVDLDLSMLDHEGFPHFMLKEIFDQPNVLKDCMRGRIVSNPYSSDSLNSAALNSEAVKPLNQASAVKPLNGTALNSSAVKPLNQASAVKPAELSEAVSSTERLQSEGGKLPSEGGNKSAECIKPLNSEALNGSALNSSAVKPLNQASAVKPLNGSALNSEAVKPLNQASAVKPLNGSALNPSFALYQVVLSAVTNNRRQLLRAKRIIIVSCGTSWHAGLIGKQLIEHFCRIPVEVAYASEFRYSDPVIEHDDVVMAISQSGETADTLAAIQLAKAQGALVFGIVNGVGSSIARESDTGTYIHVGPEIGVASTKAFTGQVTVLTLISLALGMAKGTVTEEEYQTTIKELLLIPEKIEKILLQNDKIQKLAQMFTYARNFLYLGRGWNYPVALEGALKLKEISYIHAEGYPAAEMKHGPIALVDTEMPVVFIATHHQLYEKIISNMQEVKSRNGRIIAIVTEGDEQVKNMVEDIIEVPKTLGCLAPLLTVIPLQLLSYHVAVAKGLNVDQPRNLAKSVTVE